MSEIRTRTVEANGLSFAIDEAGEGDKVALLLHGFPESRRCWRHQLPALAALGWRAVAPDLRGYGASSRPQGREPYRIEHLVADAAALFDALGAKQRLLVGHDWGGVIAWAFAIGRALPLDGLVVLNAPHPAVFRAALRNGWAQRRRSWYMALFRVPWLPERLFGANRAARLMRAIRRSARRSDTFPPEIIEHYRDNASQPGALTAMLNYYRALDLGAMPVAGQIDTPTLLLWGERDTALGPELAEPTRAYVRDLAIERFAEVSHWLPEEAPDAVNAAMSAWLRERGLAA